MLSDLRFALRSLLKTPGFTAVAMLIVALGIGASTAMFGVVNALVLRPLALPAPDRLAVVYETQLERNRPQFSVSIPNYYDWTQRASSWESLAALGSRSLNLVGGAEPEFVNAGTVTANFLSTFGVVPVLGRNFLADEDRLGGAKVVILSGGFWQRRFGGAREVLGRTLTLDGAAYTVVGITAPGEPLPVDFDLFIPLAADVAQEDRMDHYIDVYGRLKTGVSLEQADAEMKAIAAQIWTEHPQMDRGWSTTIVPLEREIVGDSVRNGVYVLLGAVGVLLLIACANLSNLVLVRATARTHELAVRTALGASRWQIARQLATESLLVTALGGLAGLVGVVWSLEALRSLPLPRAAEIGLDYRVLAVAVAATLLTGLLAGIGPALRASRADPQQALRSRSPQAGARARLRDSMVVAQLALSLTLLIGATLLARSFWRLVQVDPGFNPEQVVTMALRPLANVVATVAFYDAVEREVSALPDVTHVGSISRLPLTPGNTQNDIYSVGPSLLPAGQPVQASWRLIHGDYFGTLQIPLLRGRDFRGMTRAEARTSMVISASLARALWGDEDPLGRQIDRGGNHFTVIGVVGDVRSQQLGAESIPAFYMSIHRFTFGYQSLAVRTKGEIGPFVSALRQTIRRIDPTVPVFQIRTMNDIRAASLQQERLLIALLGGFAGAALLLAALGTYGVVAFTVQQRTTEIGIRIAIGAQTGDVLRLVLGQSARLAALGLLLGLAGALAGTRVLSSLLYQTPATDLASFALAALVLATAALVASLIPARRAARVDPLTALRAE